MGIMGRTNVQVL